MPDDEASHAIGEQALDDRRVRQVRVAVRVRGARVDHAVLVQLRDRILCLVPDQPLGAAAGIERTKLLAIEPIERREPAVDIARDFCAGRLEEVLGRDSAMQEQRRAGTKSEPTRAEIHAQLAARRNVREVAVDNGLVVARLAGCLQLRNAMLERLPGTHRGR